jgi:hypothetical protein
MAFFSINVIFVMELFSNPLVGVETRENIDAVRLADVEAEFTVARLAFNASYRRFQDHHKAHKTGPFFMRFDRCVSIQFLHETAEAKALVVDATKKREKLHSLMADRAALRFKLGLSK